MIQWGRKGVIAGAFAFTFTTAPTGVNTVQSHELHDGIQGQFNFTHVTTAAPPGSYIQRHHLNEGLNGQFTYRYLIPGEEIEEVEEAQHGGDSRRSRVYRTKDVYQALIEARMGITEAIDEGITGHELALRERALEQAEQEVRGRLARKSPATPREIRDFVKALRFEESISETQDMEALLLILLIDEITDD
ncbi:MAG: hypothetical protein OES84_00120 [Kiritimatiellaceae bacterium]|nr:hypothetical protein [Kiritimatiellaceae bacterium]